MHLHPELKCSACQFVADKASGKIKKVSKTKWAKMTRSDKSEKLVEALAEVCEKGIPEQTASYLLDGKKTYVDFRELMSKGGSMTGLNMGLDTKKELINGCLAISKLYAEEVGGSYAEAKHPRRYDLEHELCVTAAKVCDSEREDDDDEGFEDAQEKEEES